MHNTQEFEKYISYISQSQWQNCDIIINVVRKPRTFHFYSNGRLIIPIDN